MRYRILAVLAALMVVIGLATPAASASTQSAPAVADSWSGHLVANVDHSLGVTFPGTGHQATVTTSPGNTTIEFINATDVIIKNNNGNCLYMRDAANGHAVMEASGCNTSNPAQQWLESSNLNSQFAFQNVDYGYYLGLSCTPSNGSPLWGVTGNTGTCFLWKGPPIVIGS